MVTVRTTCTRCSAQVRLSANEVVVAADPARVSFICSSCDELDSQPLGPADRQRLVSAGVPVFARHPERPRGGPRLTPDDLLDLHLALANPQWFSLLARL